MYQSYNDISFRGTFIEFRSGMINISPIGRNCSKEERNAYEKHDLVSVAFYLYCARKSDPLSVTCVYQANNVRKDMVLALQNKFAHLNLKYSIGGQISFDVFPQGWDKTYCLNHIAEGEYDEIHFFGDKTFEGEDICLSSCCYCCSVVCKCCDIYPIDRCVVCVFVLQAAMTMRFLCTRASRATPPPARRTPWLSALRSS